MFCIFIRDPEWMKKGAFREDEWKNQHLYAQIIFYFPFLYNTFFPKSVDRFFYDFE